MHHLLLALTQHSWMSALCLLTPDVLLLFFEVIFGSLNLYLYPEKKTKNFLKTRWLPAPTRSTQVVGVIGVVGVIDAMLSGLQVG